MLAGLGIESAHNAAVVHRPRGIAERAIPSRLVKIDDGGGRERGDSAGSSAVTTQSGRAEISRNAPRYLPDGHHVVIGSGGMESGGIPAAGPRPRPRPGIAFIPNIDANLTVRAS